MADADNFEEDLFADLYADEDDTSKAAQPVPEVVKTEPLVVNGASTAKEEPVEEPTYNPGDEQMYNNEKEEEDDEIDFNLGGGNEYSAPAQQDHQGHGPGIKEDG
jgi:RNA-binding protein Musashi